MNGLGFVVLLAHIESVWLLELLYLLFILFEFQDLTNRRLVISLFTLNDKVNSKNFKSLPCKSSLTTLFQDENNSLYWTILSWFSFNQLGKVRKFINYIIQIANKTMQKQRKRTRNRKDYKGLHDYFCVWFTQSTVNIIYTYDANEVRVMLDAPNG